MIGCYIKTPQPRHRRLHDSVLPSLLPSSCWYEIEMENVNIVIMMVNCIVHILNSVTRFIERSAIYTGILYWTMQFGSVYKSQWQLFTGISYWTMQFGGVYKSHWRYTY